MFAEIQKKLESAYDMRKRGNTDAAVSLLQTVKQGDGVLKDSLDLLLRIYSSEIDGLSGGAGESSFVDDRLTDETIKAAEIVESKVYELLSSKKYDMAFDQLAEYVRKFYYVPTSLDLVEKANVEFSVNGRQELSTALLEGYLGAIRILSTHYAFPGSLTARDFKDIKVSDLVLPPLRGNGNDFAGLMAASKNNEYVSAVHQDSSVTQLFIWGDDITEDDTRYWESIARQVTGEALVTFIGSASHETDLVNVKSNPWSVLGAIDQEVKVRSLSGRMLIAHASVRITGSLRSAFAKPTSNKAVICPRFSIDGAHGKNDSLRYVRAINRRIDEEVERHYHLRATMVCVTFDISVLDQLQAVDEMVHLQCCDTELFWRLGNNGAYFVTPESGVCWFGAKSGQRLDQAFKYYYSSRKNLNQLYPLSTDRKLSEQYKVPLVDIYIPLYNCEKYIEEAINSCLNQTVKDIRICISDDGSSDDSVAIVKRLQVQHKNIVLEEHSNSGISITTMRAIGLGNGLLIAQLDSDDLLMPDAVETLIAPLLKDEELGCAYGSCERIDGDGKYLKNEYDYPRFEREKMLSTSICHHFRMWKRKYYNRTTKFNPFIVNGIDYDFFSKLGEVTKIHHHKKILYRRRWHGGNTSIRREKDQTRNTYICIINSILRQGLSDVLPFSPNVEEPRRIQFKRKKRKTMLFRFPDYSYSNPYQNLLYKGLSSDIEVKKGGIESAIGSQESGIKTLFHLHWLNFILNSAESDGHAETLVDKFLLKLKRFKEAGGYIIWTVHNKLEHNRTFTAQDVRLRSALCALADKIHLHDRANYNEVFVSNPIPEDKLVVHAHGNYFGAYGDFDIEERETRILAGKRRVLIFGQLRKYKDLNRIVEIVDAATRSGLQVTIAGNPEDETVEYLIRGRFSENRNVVLNLKRIPNDEINELLVSHDIGVLSYSDILTSGTLRLFQSYGLIPVAPDLPLFDREIERSVSGFVYSADQSDLDSVFGALVSCDDQYLLAIARESYLRAVETDWRGPLTKTINLAAS